MSKKPYCFGSIFAKEMRSYLSLRESQGHQASKEMHILRTLDQYLQSNEIEEKQLPHSIVEGWLQSLPEKMHINTKIVYISHFTQYANYLRTLGISAFIPERPREDRLYAPYIFSHSELVRMFATVDGRVFERKGDKTAQLQFPLVLRMLYGCGLRVDEVLTLRTEDVDLDAGILFIRNAKGNKDRLVPMDSSLTEICRRYAAVCGKSAAPQSLLFENRKGERRSQTWVHSWFCWVLKKSGIDKPELPRYNRNICPHCLRHTFAVDSFRKQDLAGVDLYAAAPLLSTYLGHTKSSGTQRYLHMTAENNTDILNKTNNYTHGLFPEVPM